MASYPGSLATNSSLYIAVNGLQTTLAVACTSGDTTLTLTSTTGFPTTGLVTIDNTEVVSYTGIAGATITGCTRGADGTTAASHPIGVTVGLTVVAAHHNLLKDEIIAIETALGISLANVFPATPTTGTGNVVLQTSPTLITPNLGTPSAVNLANATNLPNSATTGTAAATPNTLMLRDASVNSKINNLVENFSTTVTAAGTTALTVTSSKTQQFTGTSTQTVTLPDATTLSVGLQFVVLNRSTGAVAVNNNGGSLQQSVTAATAAIFTVTNVATANGTWDVNTAAGGITQLTGDVTAGPGSGSQVATVALVGGKAASAVATSVDQAALAVANIPNILDNGGMEIWQRGTSFSSPASNVFTADRWKVRAGSTTTGITVTQESGATNKDNGNFSMKVVNTTSGGRWNIEQPVENFASLSGKTVTVSCRVKCDTAAAVRIAIEDSGALVAYSSFHTGGNTFETLSVSVTLTNPCTNLGIHWGMIDSGNKVALTMYLDSAMLIIGSAPAIFVPADPQIELARCQRYFEKSYAINTDPGTNSSATSTRLTCTSVSATPLVDTGDVFFKVSKRVTPTITLYQDNTSNTTGIWTWTNTSGTGSNLSSTADRITINGFTVQESGTAESIARGHWTADAEI